MEYPGFIGPSSRNRSPLAGCERTVNLYVEARDSQSNRAGLYTTPGFQSYIAMTGGITDVGGRALRQMNGRAFGLIGAGVYELFATQTAIKLGTVVQDSNLGAITLNGIGGNQAAFASGGSLYVLNLATNVLSAALLPGEVTQAGMLDGYGIWFNKTLGKVRLSNLNDFATNDPTQFAIRSSAPDNWTAMIVNAPDVFLIGEQSGDVWYDAGTFPFPLAPRNGASFKYGISATFSLAAAGDSVLWLSRNAEGAGIVVRARGYVPQPVSSKALETAISGYARTATITDAEALVTQFEGHTFYILRFPAANATWAYDLAQGTWIELGKWNVATGAYDVWTPRVTCYAFGKHLVADTTGSISEMDISFPTEADGGPKRWLRIPPPLVATEDRLFVDQLTLQVEPGLGTVTGQGADPQVMLRVSLNFGKTWGPERTASVGKTGQYDRLVQWNGGGSSVNSWLPEFSGTDPIAWHLVGADVRGSGFAQAQAA